MIRAPADINHRRHHVLLPYCSIIDIADIITACCKRHEITVPKLKVRPSLGGERARNGVIFHLVQMWAFLRLDCVIRRGRHIVCQSKG